MNLGLTDTLKGIRERCEKATPGPWLNGYPNACKITPMPDHVWSIHKDLIGKDLETNDADFIAHSRSDIPKLIAVIEKLMEQRDECARIAGLQIWTADNNQELLAILKEEGK